MARGKLNVPTTLPEWFTLMNQNATLSARDVANLFGFSNTDSIRESHFPPPDYVSRGHNGNPRRFWKVSTIKAEIVRRRGVA